MLWQFALMQILTPVYAGLLRAKGVLLGRGSILYGAPLVHRHRGSSICIGGDFENRNWYSSNPLGARGTFLSTWTREGEIIIGDNVGISGVVLCSAKSIRIGNGVLVGANTTIVDTDFHPLPLSPKQGRQKETQSKAIVIEDNVFIGMNCVILKGVTVGEGSVVGAGSIVAKDIPSHSVAAGNPAKVIKAL